MSMQRMLEATARAQDAIRRGATRREVLEGLATLGLSAGVAGTVLGQATAAIAQTPKRGGRLRVAGFSQSKADSLDPAKFTLSTDYIRGFTFYNGLVTIDPKSHPMPELAESFEVDRVGTRWTFKLRRGVEFHDGKTLDADDVVFSIMRHKDPAVASAAKALAAQIKSVHADGKDTVVVDIEAPNADLPVILGTSHFMIVKNGTTDFSTGPGTGPFKVGEFRPGVRSVGVRFPNYFKQGRPYVDESVLFAITDPVARLSALIAGDVHMAAELKPNNVSDLQSASGVHLLSTPSPTFVELVTMVDRKPTDNLDLRLAIKYLINRERLASSVFRGQAVVANDHPVAPSSELYNAALPQRTVDIDRAKFHLRKAGMENGRIELNISDASAGMIDMGVLLQPEATRAGLTVNLRREPSDGYWSDVWIKKPFYSSSWNARPTYDILLTLGWKSDAAWNEAHFKSERLDKLIDLGRGELDPGRRKATYGEIQQIIYEQGGNAIGAFINFIDGVSNKVRGLVANPLGNLGGFNYGDTVWLDT